MTKHTQPETILDNSYMPRRALDDKMNRGKKVSKKNCAQDRLDRIRSDVKRKIEDKLDKFCERDAALNPTSTSQRTNILLERFLPDKDAWSESGKSCLKNKLHRYSADKRLENARAHVLNKSHKTSPRKSSERATAEYDTTIPVKIHNKKDKVNPSHREKSKYAERGGVFERTKSTQSSPNKPESHNMPKGTAKSNKRRRSSAQKRLEKLRSLDKDDLKRASTYDIVKNETFSSRQGCHSSYNLNESSWTDNIIEKQNNVSMDVDMEMDEITGIVDSTVIPSAHNLNALFNINNEWPAELSSSSVALNEEIYKIRQEPSYLALHENFASDVEMNLSLPCSDLLIVVDTNIFLSHLKFLIRLTNCTVSNYRSHVLVIPWLVIQEIDFAMKKDNKRLASAAKSANTFIFEYLKKGHPRIFGQSLEDFKTNFKNAVSVDDFILQYCLKFIVLKNNVILLTDDKNLCSKGMVNNLTVYTKLEFERRFNISN